LVLWEGYKKLNTQFAMFAIFHLLSIHRAYRINNSSPAAAAKGLHCGRIRMPSGDCTTTNIPDPGPFP
jgi:hypothetical protein